MMFNWNVSIKILLHKTLNLFCVVSNLVFQYLKFKEDIKQKVYNTTVICLKR